MSESTRLPLLEVSLALEWGHPTPLSTHWMPLDELLAHWLDSEMLLALAAPVAPLLTAIGHALFALSHETRALRLYTQPWHAPQQMPPADVPVTRSSCRVVVSGHLHEAAHHWGRAAFALDTLLPADLDPSALARARQLSRVARTQQERLWALMEEVQAEQAVSQPQQRKEAEA